MTGQEDDTLEPTSLAFRENSRRALGDPLLQEALSGLVNWQAARAAAAAALPEFEQLRDLGRDIKNHTLAHLDLYLERFTAAAEAAGAKVHWARDAAEARAHVLAICREAKARTVTKSKSMIAEEIGLNPYLEANGIQPIETDLGEYIIQLAGERPSHLIGPAIHKTKGEVADLFQRHHGGPKLEEPGEMVAEARRMLRRRYLEADVGVTGANFLIAETGSIVTVTNEGNAELTQGLPRIHVCVASIEKLVPTVEDAFTLLRLLPRSATGQEFAGYTTVITGPRRPGDLDGPEQFHIVLVDNGRSKMVGTVYQDMLRCIRCGACMNYRLATRLAGGVLGLAGRRRGRFRRLPLASGWTGTRDLPAPEGGTFMAQWASRPRSRP